MIDAEAEAPILWPLDGKSRLIGKDLDARKEWRQRRRELQRMRYLDSINSSMDMRTGKPGMLSVCHHKESVSEQQQQQSTALLSCGFLPSSSARVD